MATISNRTKKSVSVPLLGGKTLYLGPAQTGQVTAKALENPKLLALVESGEIEVDGGKFRPTVAAGGAKKGRTFANAHNLGGAIRRSGDR